MIRRYTIALLALVLASPAVAGEDVKTVWERQVNDKWMLDEVRGSVSNLFRFCTIRTTYQASNTAQRRTMRAKEIMLMMMYGGETDMSVTVAGDQWQITEGKEYKVRFRFKSGQSWSIKARGLAERGVISSFKADGDWVARMMLDSNFILSINDQELGVMRLDGSAEAIKALMECAIKGRNEADVSKDGADTFGPAPAAKDTF